MIAYNEIKSVGTYMKEQLFPVGATPPPPRESSKHSALLMNIRKEKQHCHMRRTLFTVCFSLVC